MLGSTAWVGPSAELGTDVSWKAILHYAHSNQLQFGRDVIFTYGPWGWCLAGWLYPPTFWPRALFVTLVTIVLYASLRTFLRRQRVTRAAAPFLALLLVQIALVHDDAWGYLVCVLPLLLVWSATRERWRLPDLVHLNILVFLLPFLGLMKHTLAICAAAVMATILGHALQGDRRLASTFGTLAAGAALAWGAAGQSLATLPAYVSTAVMMAGGYTEAMALFVDPKVDALTLLSGFGAGLTLVLALLARDPRRRLLDGLFVFALVFLVFKSSIIRPGFGHTYIALSVFSLVAILGLVLSLADTPPRESRTGITTPWARAVLFGAASLTLALVLFAFPHDSGTDELAARFGRGFVDAFERARRATGYLRSPGLVREDFDLQCRLLQPKLELPPIHGSVDLFGHLQAALIAWQLDYLPRPVIQSYAACTPSLVRLNQDHLAGTSAPEYVVLKVVSMDRRYPALSDGPSYLTLLTHYSIRQVIGGGWYLLKRRPEPFEVEQDLLAGHTVSFGQEVSLPIVSPGVAVLAEIRIRPTLRGRLASLLYKTPTVYLRATTAEGRVGQFRVVPAVAQTGFILSPLLARHVSWGALATGQPQEVNRSMSVVSFTLDVDLACGGRRNFQDRVDIRLYRLRLPHDPGEAVADAESEKSRGS